ncbi:MAG TPA: roadblock/LC7 domain-containing protein [Ktedonobacteraceae bacterium]|nr:roadblock/LC7 domain-containing protein [Ktedonobacteraceae bacterium]
METILQRLTDLDEITGALIIGKDGLIVAGALPGDDEDMLGAMSAAIFGSIASYTAQAVHSETRHVIIETHTGSIQFAEVGDLILVITAGPGSNTGRVRLEMKKASQKLADLVATY